MLRLCLTFVLLGFMQVSFAKTDFLNLQNYKTGDTPAYAKHIIVKEDEATGEKWLTGDGNAKREIGQLAFPVNLSGAFDLTIRLDKNVMKVYLTAEDELNQILLDFCSYCVRIYVTDKNVDQKIYASSFGYGVDTVRLSVEDNTAKVYVNGLLHKKTDLKPNLKYTRLTVMMDNRDDLYELYLGGDNSITSTSLTGDFENGKQAGIQQCVSNPSSCGISVTGTTTTVAGDCIADYVANTGELHIPCIRVPGAFGQTEIYDVWLKQLNNSLNFELDLNRVKVK